MLILIVVSVENKMASWDNKVASWDYKVTSRDYKVTSRDYKDGMRKENNVVIKNITDQPLGTK